MDTGAEPLGSKFQVPSSSSKFRQPTSPRFLAKLPTSNKPGASPIFQGYQGRSYEAKPPPALVCVYATNPMWLVVDERVRTRRGKRDGSYTLSTGTRHGYQDTGLVTGSFLRTSKTNQEVANHSPQLTSHITHVPRRIQPLRCVLCCLLSYCTEAGAVAVATAPYSHPTLPYPTYRTTRLGELRARAPFYLKKKNRKK
jgi:hypothetical protein